MIDRRVLLTAEDMKTLLLKAKEVGTLEQWAAVAIQWMEAADVEITRLTEEKKDD